MRVKAINTFIMNDGKVVLPGTEVDVPHELGDYLLGEGAVHLMPGGKGQHTVLVDEEVVREAEEKAASPETLNKMVTPKVVEKPKQKQVKE